MLPVKTHRDAFAMVHMIDKNDYNLLKQKAPQIIQKLSEFDKLPINDAILQTKTLLDYHFPNFFEVFTNQTYYGSIITVAEALEKWKTLDWEMPMSKKIQQSAFYKILLSNENWNKDYLFDSFIETFYLKGTDLLYLIYKFGVIEEFKYKVFLSLNHSYITNLINYFDKLLDTKDYLDYVQQAESILDDMWRSISVYAHLNRTDIDKYPYLKEWEKFKNNPKEYLINYLKNHKSKWKIEDLK